MRSKKRGLVVRGSGDVTAGVWRGIGAALHSRSVAKVIGRCMKTIRWAQRDGQTQTQTRGTAAEVTGRTAAAAAAAAAEMARSHLAAARLHVARSVFSISNCSIVVFGSVPSDTGASSYFQRYRPTWVALYACLTCQLYRRSRSMTETECGLTYSTVLLS